MLLKETWERCCPLVYFQLDVSRRSRKGCQNASMDTWCTSNACGFSGQTRQHQPTYLVMDTIITFKPKTSEKKQHQDSDSNLVGGFNPFEKICSSNWITSPGRGKTKKCLTPEPPPRNAFRFTKHNHKQWVFHDSILGDFKTHQVLLPSMVGLLVPVKGGIGSIWGPPEGNI